MNVYVVIAGHAYAESNCIGVYTDKLTALRAAKRWVKKAQGDGEVWPVKYGADKSIDGFESDNEAFAYAEPFKVAS